MRTHLEGCPACRTELRQLEGIATLLPLADPDRVSAPEHGPDSLAQSLFARLALDRQRSRRRRFAATAVVPVAAVAGFLVFAPGDAADGGREVVLEAGEVSGRAELFERAWGTEVRMEVAGLPEGQQHTVWLRLDDGSRVAAGTFTGGGQRELVVGLAAAADTDDTILLAIEDSDGAMVVRAPVES